MKRLLLFAGILLHISTQAQYQTQKGRWTIGHTIGGFGYSNWNYKEYEADVLEYDAKVKGFSFRLAFVGPDWGNIAASKEKTTTQAGDTSQFNRSGIWLQPQAGYFITDNFLVGVNLLIGTETGKYSYSNVVNKGTASAIGIGPIAKYYFGKNTKHKPFAGFESRIDFTKEKSTNEYNPGPTKDLSENKDTGDRLMIRPYVGYGWFLGKRWTAEVRVDYTYIKENGKQTSRQYEDGILQPGYPRFESYNYTGNTMSLSIGISYTF